MSCGFNIVFECSNPEVVSKALKCIGEVHVKGAEVELAFFGSEYQTTDIVEDALEFMKKNAQSLALVVDELEIGGGSLNIVEESASGIGFWEIPSDLIRHLAICRLSLSLCNLKKRKKGGR